MLESNETNGDPASFDYLSMKKLRHLYASCMNEDLLNERGDEPILEVTKIVRDLFRSDSWISSVETESPMAKNGLTAAVAFLHSRGKQTQRYSYTVIYISEGIGGLFGFDIDGDVGTDPNNMSLWFSQPSLGLPSKVRRLL